MNGDSIFFDWDLPLGFLVAPLEFCSIFHSERILRRPFGICQSRFLPGRHLPQNSAETQVSRFADFYWSGDLLGMLPALQNSGTAKWGSAPSDRILKPHDAEKNGISFAGICNLQISTAAPDFSFLRAQRLWDVICAIWDLLRCAEICKSAVIEFSGLAEILLSGNVPKSAALCLRGSEI